MPNAEIGPAAEGASQRPDTLHGTSFRSLYVENLKSLWGPHDIQLAPLTLIYGPNAAGKSTVLQSIRLVQTWLARLDSSLIEGEEWKKILAEHARLISGHDETLPLVLGFEFSPGGQGLEPGGLIVRVRRSEHHPGGIQVNLRSTESTDAAQVTLESAVESPEWGGDAYRFVPRDPAVLANARLAELLGSTFFLGPHRGDPADPYIYRGSSFLPWSLSARNLKDEELNAWLSRLGVPYRVSAVSVEDTDPEEADYLRSIDRTADWADEGMRLPTSIDHWDLVDTRSNVQVRLADVGYGVGQLLPIVDLCVRDARQVICIEQPELHLHPRLQGNLGELLVDSVNRGHQILAETHSENILLRVRRLIRAGQFESDQLAVLYVDNSVEGVTVRQLRIGGSGELLDPWPTGFFDDTLADILGITE